MRLLVIEDEIDLQRAVSQSLHEAGYAVDVAADGREGLFKASTGDYDGIVLDIMLPKMDGFSLLRELRRSKTTPVLILTARDAVPDRIEGLDAGADDYLAKPYEQAELLARVRAILRRGAGGAVAVAEIGQVTAGSLAHTVSTLDLARRIQMRLTPRQPQPVPGIDVAVHYQPAQWVGGDYCDLWTLNDGRLAFVVADVSGKGLPAAMVMASLHASLHAGMAFCSGPAQAIEYVNEHMLQHLPEGLFVTLFLGLLDVHSGRLVFLNAGHMPPLLSRPGVEFEPLGESHNGVLGIDSGPFVAQERTLPPGACLLALTDGITETESPEGDQFGIHRVQAVLRAQNSPTAQQMVRAVAEAASTFRGAGPQEDDVTVLGLRRMRAGEA